MWRQASEAGEAFPKLWSEQLYCHLVAAEKNSVPLNEFKSSSWEADIVLRRAYERHKEETFEPGYQ